MARSIRRFCLGIGMVLWAMTIPFSWAYWVFFELPSTSYACSQAIGTWNEYWGATNYDSSTRYSYGEKVLEGGRLWIVIVPFVQGIAPSLGIGKYNEVTTSWRSYNTYLRDDRVFYLNQWWQARNKNVNQVPGVSGVWYVL